MTSTLPRRRSRVLIAALCLLAPLAFAQPTLTDRLSEIREIGRYVPDKALKMLVPLEAEAAKAPLADRSEYLVIQSISYLYLGDTKQAMSLTDKLIALGKEHKDNTTLVKGQLVKVYILFAMNELKASHQLAWDTEKLANTISDNYLRVQTAISSGQSYAEEGNLPAALSKLQSAVALARQENRPITMSMALRALAQLYDTMKEYDKGFEVLDEANSYAMQTHSLGRMATLKETEYALAIDSHQPKRALRALLDALELERRIGADTMMATTLVNLSDAYLKDNNYPKVLNYAQQAIGLAQKLNDQATEATARINIGQALLGTGRIADGKRAFETGLAYYEQQGDKPSLQAIMAEYGSALERVGDMAGAVKAYHRERALSNELFEKQRQKAIWEMQEKYETEKKQKQIELLRRENQVKGAELDNRRLQQRVWWLLAVVFALVAVIVGLLYRKVRQTNAQLEVKNLELKQQSSRDPLTALYNRRHFQDFMRNHAENERRGTGLQGEEIVGALFLLDVDHFKHVNDTYGHAAGDAVLRMIAESLRVILRETDMIVRWGGEEFLAFLPAIPRSGIEEIARRLLSGISAHTIDYQDTKISVNVSIGFAPFPLVPGSQPLPWERAVNLVDMALYLAKAHGRNRAYGVRGFAKYDQVSLEAVEQDLERAWRNGYVDLSVVLGGWPEPKPSSSAAVASAA